MGRKWVAACMALALIAASVGRAAEKSPPEEVLAEKGLSRSGHFFLLDADLKLHENLRAMRSAKSQLDQYNASRARLEQKRQNIIAAQANLDAKIRDANYRLNKTSKKARNYNNIVAEVNYLGAQVREGERALAQTDQEIAKLKNPQAQYLSAVAGLADSMETAVKQYETLAADPQVKSAIEEFSTASGTPYKLGPSNSFTDELPLVRKERQRINTGVIKLDVRQGVAYVDVTLNEKVTQRMILDSGASNVSIAWSVAEELGIKPGPNDPEVVAQLADGRTVKSKLLVLKAIALGPFVAHNIQCEVSPESAADAPCLLGGSFLRHFVYSMDLTAGELHLSELAEKDPSKPAGAPADSHGPMILVSSPDDIRLNTLKAGAARLYGGRIISIDALGKELEGLRFTVVPRLKEVSYAITVRKAGILYVFGQNRTPMSQAFGDDAANWERVDGLIAGDAIRVCYRRQVAAGDHLALHGYELNVAADGIELRPENR